MIKKVIFSLLLFVAFCSFLKAQDFIITGQIFDQDNEPLPGATVLIKGSTTGTVTDIDGRYTIKASDDNQILVFSFVGMVTQEIPIRERTEINVVLESSAIGLDEVVAIGYGVQEKSLVTGSISKINAEEITSTPALRVEQSLQGRTSGVQVVQNSGSPGAGLTVRIRGAGTTGNSDPLWVVDGMPTGGIDFLNPGDIESMEILKDAASSAIYGARGANGVVIITTKQGRQMERAEISFDSYYGVQSASNKLDLLNAEQYATIVNEAHINGGESPIFNVQDIVNEVGAGTNWQDEVFISSPIQSHQLTIRGGDAKKVYSLSASYFKQDGIIGGDGKSDYERGTARFNSKREILNWFSLTSNISFSHSIKNTLDENSEFHSILSSAINMDPITPVRDENGDYGKSNYVGSEIANPVARIDYSNNTSILDKLLGGVVGDFRIAEGLNFTTSFNIDLAYQITDIFTPVYNLSPAYRNDVSNVSKEFNKWETWLWENVLTYDTQIDEHDFFILGGTTAQASQWENLYGFREGVPNDDIRFAFLSSTTIANSDRVSGSASHNSLASYFTRLNYSFSKKYLFSSTVRVDGSSRFGENNKYAIFPSFSAGWVLSKENFMENVDFLSWLKLRLSWGQNGNQEIGDNMHIALIEGGNNYVWGSGNNENIYNGSSPVALSNPDLKWETSEQFDIGIDVRFLNNKVEINADYYKKKTKDLLVQIPTPDYLGIGWATGNAGDVENKGFEFDFTYRDKAGKLSYSIGGNISTYRNKVTYLGTDNGILDGATWGPGGTHLISRAEVGYPIGYFYGYVTDGIFQNQAEINAHANENGELLQPNAQPGDIRFQDINNDGVIDDNDRTMIGNPHPDFLYGINISLDYENFDLSIFIQGSQGNDIYNATERVDLTNVNKTTNSLNRWTGEGTSNSEPRVTTKDNNNNARVSDRFVEDGSYLRLKNIQLGYSLPKSITERINVKKLRIYISAQNLFTITNYSGFDPEIGTNESTLDLGIDRGFYPQPRMFLTGMNLTF